MSLDDFFRESGLSANVLQEAKPQAALLTEQVGDKFKDDARLLFPHLDFSASSRKIRQNNIGRLPNQIVNAKARIRAWEKDLQNAIAVKDIDRVMADMDIQLACTARAENAGLSMRTTERRPKRRKRIRQDNVDVDDCDDIEQRMAAIHVPNSPPVQHVADADPASLVYV